MTSGEEGFGEDQRAIARARDIDDQKQRADESRNRTEKVRRDPACGSDRCRARHHTDE